MTSEQRDTGRKQRKVTAKGKVVVIGLDGATWDLVLPWVEEGELPAFRKLIREGAYGNLESTIPPITPAAWTSIFTGVNPGKHSVFGFIKRKEDSYFVRPVSSQDKKVKSIWHLLSERGRKMVLINIPFTYPVDRVKGIMISGLGTPSRNSNFTHPPEFKQQLLRKFPNYYIDFNEDLILRSSDKSFILEQIKAVTATQIKVGKYLFENEDWHLFTIVVRSPDTIQHYYWNDQETILEYYRQADEFMQWVMAGMTTDTTLLVCSDHGFFGVSTRVHINNWLDRLNLLQLNKVRNGLWNKLLPSAETLHRILAKFGFRRLVWNLKRSQLLEIVMKHFVHSEGFQYIFDIDWLKTKACFLEASAGIININLKGREPQGVVEEEEFEALREYIIKEALKLVDPATSHNVIKGAYKGNEVYFGESSNIPDVLLLANEGYRLVGVYNRAGDIFEPEKELTGNHYRTGIIAAYGRGIRRGGRIKVASVYDVTPIILQLMGIPIPNYMDGAPSEQLLDADVLALKPSSRKEEQIRDRIRELKRQGKL